MERFRTADRPQAAPEAPRRAPARRLLAASLVALACVGAQTGVAQAVPAAPSETAAAQAASDFYTPPATLPAQNGALVRTEPLPLAISLPTLGGPFPGKATRLMYRSTDSAGQPVAVTGAYVEPTAQWRGGGARPLVAVAPGTMGQGDECAASKGLQYPILLEGDSLSVGYEDLSIYRLLASGVAVVVTDYVGLGATDRLHTYVNRVDGAHAVLDAVRAARSLPGTSLTSESRIGLYGYSQGGGATAAAAELAASYAPDVRLSGTYAGAPPADLTETIKGIDGSALTGALGWSLNGFLQAYPDLRPIADAHLNDKGRAALEDLSGMCIGDSLLGYGFRRSSSWTNDGSSLSQIVEREPRIREVLDEQRIGDRKPSGPVRVATGVQDDIVPHRQSRQMAVDWCRKGGNVTYKAIVLPNLGDKILTNHMVPLLTDQGAAVDWLKDRLEGKAAASNCWSMPVQP
ncbi:lipase family protein [Streptomyces sp. NPDC002734]|uniref:lipase family protein n=1 Tax=Streptomyces sp. NPDC002734 TaxID=3154426 RepID=UPI003325B54C